jgi:hypothetical protein
MERRFLPALFDHGTGIGAFATRWEGWKNPRKRAGPSHTTGRINVSHPDDIEIIDDQMGLYIALYEPTAGSRYVAYVGYSKGLRKELKIRYGQWEADGRVVRSARAKFPFVAFYLPNQEAARVFEDDLIRYYCPPWNTKFHR